MYGNFKTKNAYNIRVVGCIMKYKPIALILKRIKSHIILGCLYSSIFNSFVRLLVKPNFKFRINKHNFKKNLSKSK